MSSAEQNSPKEKHTQADETPNSGSLQSPPKRPTLVSPPRRPARRSASHAAEDSAAPDSGEVTASPTPDKAHQSSPSLQAEAPSQADTQEAAAARCQPIAPPSEPMQYRAIGLVRGTYQPTEADQLNRGALITEDGTVIDSVLLGRVTSLVKKHIDLAASHLWVVYPRTRRGESSQDHDLHLQIVGVWEPETLGLPGEASAKAEDEKAEDQVESTAEANDGPSAAEASQAASEDQSSTPQTIDTAELPAVNDNYFSVRGEVVKYSPEEELISVKILQGIKRSPGASKPFKVNLKGTIEGRTVGYFWDFKAKREEHLLVLEDASVVGIVPPKKRGKKKDGPYKSPRGGGNRPMPARRSADSRGSHRPRRLDAGKDLRA